MAPLDKNRSAVTAQEHVKLTAIPKDIENMKDLWLNTFKYDSKYVSIITEDVGSEFITAQELNKQLNKIQGKLNQELDEYKECDGLIFIYSGHGSTNGLDNYIMCSDLNKLTISDIQNKFS